MNRTFTIVLLMLVAVVMSGCEPEPATEIQDNMQDIVVEEPAYWIPRVGDSFQWQLTAYSLDVHMEADVYDVDMFDYPQAWIEAMHDEGKKIVCYINVGAREDWREDAQDFPLEVIGDDYEGWEGERWLDISQYHLFSHVMINRFDLAEAKGCDAIEPDNMDGYTNDTGFDLTYEAQLKYNLWLADQAHQRDMSIGLKNNPEQVQDLLEVYDWALVEDCYEYGWCGQLQPFTDAGKAVFMVEYTDSDKIFFYICQQAAEYDYFALLKNRDLKGWSQWCDL